MSYKCAHCHCIVGSGSIVQFHNAGLRKGEHQWECPSCKSWNPVISKQESIQDYNVGDSNYAEMKIQPWDIFEAHPQLNYWECDIIKRLLRDKKTDGRLLDLEKIVHIAEKLVEMEKKRLGTL